MERIEAQPGDLLLFTRAKGLNRLITWFTQSRFYHVAIFEGDTSVIEARPRGVVRRDLSGPDGDKSFIVLPAPTSRREAQQALAWAQDRIGDGYDPFNVFALVLDRVCVCFRVPSLNTDRFSCGDLVTKAFQESGAELFPEIDSEDVVPADFARFIKPAKVDDSHDVETPPQSEEATSSRVGWIVFGILALCIAGVFMVRHRNDKNL